MWSARVFEGGAIERPPLPITKPYFGEEEQAAILEPLRTGWVVQGPQVASFERRFREHTGAANAVAASSCTTALHLAVAGLELEPGDEVVVPAFTWISTANVVEYMGATPIFCDVRPDTYNIDEARIEGLITPRTVGVMPVHLFGLCAEMGPIGEIADRHGLWVVEDAACALGAWQGDRHAGTMSDAGCFSFHPRKSITTGEGGMLVTQRDELADLTRTLRDHGASRSDLDRHAGRDSFLLAEYDHLGFNYRMTDIQGALGCVQMDRAEWILGERARLAALYGERLASLRWLETPVVPSGNVHGWQAYVCVLRPGERDRVDELHDLRNALMRQLESVGVATRPGTHAAAATGYYRSKYGLEPAAFPQAHLAESLTVALPLFAGMTDDDVERVATELEQAYDSAAKDV